MNRKTYTAAAALCIALAGCAGGTRTADRAKEFSIPMPPLMEITPDNHAAFYAANFWENMDFSDTTQIGAIDEDNMSNYIATLRVVTLSREQVRSSISDLLTRAAAQPAMYRRFAAMFDRYLDGRGSHLRNEENYIFVLDEYLKSDILTAEEKARYGKRKQWAMKNRPGDKAADFAFTDINGQRGSLGAITADFTLLMFYDDSPASLQLAASLRPAGPLTAKVADGTIKVVALYAGDDRKQWESLRDSIPATWTNAFDTYGTIRRNRLYDLGALPSLYLLEKDKTVAVKDFTNPEEIKFHFLNNNLEW